mgnify:CR=1 FL=1
MVMYGDKLVQFTLALVHLPSLSGQDRVVAECVVADLFAAQTTPHVFVISREGILCYRGAVDDVTFRHRSPTRFFLDEAVESLLVGRLPAQMESPAYGCAIVREI